MKAIDLLMARHWAITPEALQSIAGIALRKNEDWEFLAGKLGKPLQYTHETRVREGIAIIPVNGPMFSKANIMTAHSGATSLEKLSHDLATAVSDPSITAIVLDINSPGGAALGPAELAGEIRQAAQTKPVIAYTGTMACSAAYWIASAASEIVAHPGAMLGSIGVVTAASYQKEADQDGNMHVEIVSSNAQKKRPDPQSADGLSQIKAELDAIENSFIDTVAQFRGVDRATVISDFGGGGILSAADAVKVGMADRLGSLEDVLAELSNRSSSTSTTGARTMTAKKKDDPAAAQPAAVDNPATATEASATSIPAVQPPAAAAPAVDQKARISAIINHPEAEGRADLAKHLAFATDMSAEDAAKTLAASPKAASASNPLADAMRANGNPKIGPGGESGADADKNPLLATVQLVSPGMLRKKA
jgi:signal peptide peptidase SppA